MNEVYLKSTGDAALGIVSWLSYSPVLDTAENERFAQAFSKKFGKDPAYNNHLGYLAAKAAGEAVNGNVEDQPRFLEALRRVRFEAPCGSLPLPQRRRSSRPPRASSRLKRSRW